MRWKEFVYSSRRTILMFGLFSSWSGAVAAATDCYPSTAGQVSAIQGQVSRNVSYSLGAAAGVIVRQVTEDATGDNYLQYSDVPAYDQTDHSLFYINRLTLPPETEEPETEESEEAQPKTEYCIISASAWPAAGQNAGATAMYASSDVFLSYDGTQTLFRQTIDGVPTVKTFESNDTPPSVVCGSENPCTANDYLILNPAARVGQGYRFPIYSDGDVALWTFNSSQTGIAVDLSAISFVMNRAYSSAPKNVRINPKFPNILSLGYTWQEGVLPNVRWYTDLYIVSLVLSEVDGQIVFGVDDQIVLEKVSHQLWEPVVLRFTKLSREPATAASLRSRESQSRV